MAVILVQVLQDFLQVLSCNFHVMGWNLARGPGLHSTAREMNSNLRANVAGAVVISVVRCTAGAIVCYRGQWMHAA